MVDIEGLGNMPGGVIISIGWCRFNLLGEISEEQEVRLSIESQMLRSQFKLDADTLEWWMEQPCRPFRKGAKAVNYAEGLRTYAKALEGADQVWAKPPTYDLIALDHALDYACLPKNKKPYGRSTWHCLKTLKSTWPHGMYLPTMRGTKHGALDDAIQQAREAATILQAFREITHGKE
jgi:hypothetical protein